LQISKNYKLSFQNIFKTAKYIVVASETSRKVIPPIRTFSEFLQLLICWTISQICDANLCESDAITLAWAVLHDATLIRTSRGLLRLNLTATC